MKLNPYLAFDGRCREAFEFYQKALGGQISFIQTIGESPMAASMPADAHGRVMHVTLQIGNQVLQGADAPPGQFTKPAGFCVAAHFDEPAEGARVFRALARNGTVQMPFQPTFWAKGFGMLIDQFGTPWLGNAGEVIGGWGVNKKRAAPGSRKVLVALVFLLRGVNVGGHRTFRPTALTRQLKHLDAVNIGAAGTFGARAPGTPAQ